MTINFKMLITSLLQFTLSFFLAIGLVAVITKKVTILISDTDSLPQHYFLLYHNSTPKLHDYTALWSDWYGKRVIKKIVGVSGDRIWYDVNGQLLVNQQPIGYLQAQASDGRALQPIKAQVIKKGMVFVAGSHARSFDSRYAEFGLVAVNKLEGLVVAIL